VLKKAAKKLGVPIHGFDFTSLGDTDVAASVTMDVPPHRGNPSTKRREFYGEWATFGSEAKESACLTALTYLKEEGLIVIHDTNFVDMKRYKRRFEEERFWASELYDRAFSLKEELSAKASMPLAPDHVAVSKSLGVYFVGYLYISSIKQYSVISILRCCVIFLGLFAQATGINAWQHVSESYTQVIFGTYI
jgi:hypothetical protein